LPKVQTAIKTTHVEVANDYKVYNTRLHI